MSKPNIEPGTMVQIKVNGIDKDAKYIEWSDKYNLAVVDCDGKRLYRKLFGVEGRPVAARKVDGKIAVVKPSRFDVNTRFAFIEKVVNMVVKGESKSVIISGSGGLGKTYTVLECLKRAKLVNVDDVEENQGLEELGIAEHAIGDYKVVKGFTTPKSLYRLLYECREKIVIFDDCDSVWDNPTTVSILKAALDSYETRRISWLTEFAGMSGEEELPKTFEFKGKIIFVSNLTLAELDQAVLSRCLYVDVSMNADEKIDRIKAISKDIRPDMTDKQKNAAIDLLIKHKDAIGDLNIRTFLKVLEIQHANSKHWEELAEYVITAM